MGTRYMDSSMPWEAQEEALHLVPELPIIPRAPTVAASRRKGFVPGPPSPDFDRSEEAIITSSFLAPEDLPLPGVEARTEFAQQGVLIADLLRTTFAQRRYGPARYRLHIVEPNGPSTGGGRQARQPLSLVSRKESVPAIVCGWVNVAQREAQVRSYGVMAQRYERRHGSTPRLTEEEYGRFLDKLMDTLFDGGFQIVHLVSDDEESQPARKSVRWLQRSSRSGLGVALLVVLAFALGMNAEFLAPGLQQVPGALSQAGSWVEEGISWLSQVPSWIRYFWHLFY
ncbi:hypothetical protein [Hyalangium sp.]|uniref:hypothetical protein n=1 Tax=Hyalangium sp. TaxID=2028555 RepID=UPI002D458D67|nr:hypothetical protein [Hyalangium sp.]HYH97315.1 hypothetical protein [Hyalangium sp.]